MLTNHALRGVEKLPGLNLLQVAHFGDRHVLMFPKVGTRSIRNAVLEFHGLGRDASRAWEQVSYTTRRGFVRCHNRPRTTVVLRDPLERLHSCWKQKVASQRDAGRFYFFQYYPLLRPDMAFPDFLAAVARISVPLREKHFIPLGHFFEPVADLRVTLIPVDDLGGLLADILGLEAPVARANTTAGDGVPDEAREVFEQRLLDQYRWDLDMYRQAVTATRRDHPDA